MWGERWGLLYPRRGDAQAAPWPGDFDLLSKYGFEGLESSLGLMVDVRCRAAAPSCKTKENGSKRLDDHRCRDRVS